MDSRTAQALLAADSLLYEIPGTGSSKCSSKQASLRKDVLTVTDRESSERLDRAASLPSLLRPAQRERALYEVASGVVAVRPAPSAASAATCVLRGGTRFFGTPYKVRGSSWLRLQTRNVAPPIFSASGNAEEAWIRNDEQAIYYVCKSRRPDDMPPPKFEVSLPQLGRARGSHDSLVAGSSVSSKASSTGKRGSSASEKGLCGPYDLVEAGVEDRKSYLTPPRGSHMPDARYEDPGYGMLGMTDARQRDSYMSNFSFQDHVAPSFGTGMMADFGDFKDRDSLVSASGLHESEKSEFGGKDSGSYVSEDLGPSVGEPDSDQLPPTVTETGMARAHLSVTLSKEEWSRCGTGAWCNFRRYGAKGGPANMNCGRWRQLPE
mmetsp:Transcript_125860/g.367784  ORF Transcript_125860/g.367784 Transcript_125860/m.367784 type:complete len:378 (-) Transcript_125860:18-1151(-)